MTRHPTNPISPQNPPSRADVGGRGKVGRGAGSEGRMEGHDPAGCREAGRTGQRRKPTQIKQASRPGTQDLHRMGPNQVLDGPGYAPRPAYSHHQEPSQPGRTGGDPNHGPRRDLCGMAGPCPLPARTANKEKAAVLVASLPPVLCWLCPEVGGRVNACHPRHQCVHGGWGRSPLDL